MKYWDSSALLPLVVREAATPAAQALLAGDADVITWWGSRMEAHAALARLLRDDHLTMAAHQEHRPATLPLVTLDARLRDAALREGFVVLPPG